MIRPVPTLLALALAGALTGCAIGPDYVRPEAAVKLPADYTAPAGAPAAGTAPSAAAAPAADADQGDAP